MADELYTAERMGQHEEQLKQLRRGQEILQDSIHQDMNELKSDMKELVNTFKEYMQESQGVLSDKIDKLEEEHRENIITITTLKSKIENIESSVEYMKSTSGGIIKTISWGALATIVGYIIKNTFGGL